MSASIVARFTLVELAFAVSACTPRPATAPLPPDLPEAPVVAVVAVVTDAAAAPVDTSEDAGPDVVPEVVLRADWWSSEVSTHPYSVSISNAEWNVSKVTAFLDASDAGFGVTATWFGGVSERAQTASEWYARAFHAFNAAPAEKVAAVLAAAENALTLAKRLDAVGLAVMPKAWRADPQLAVSFEDVAQGPSRRWRDEGLALVQLCIETALDMNVHDASTKKCHALRRAEGSVAIRRAFARDAGARGCKCAPGDPLCSETAAWCARP